MQPINRIYQIFALIMAFLMFATSVNVMVDMHYCQEQLKSFNFYGKAKNCHELQAKTMSNCPHHKKMKEQNKACSMDKKGCCTNKTLHIQSDNEQLNVSAEFTINQGLELFVVALVKVFFKANIPENKTPRFQHYQAPIVIRDIPVLNQSFLL